MKKIKYIFFLLLLLGSCDEPELRYFTRINADGSIYKRVTAVGDSAKVHRNPFSFDVSDGWDVSYSKEIIESDTVFFAIAEKTFPSVGASVNVFYSQVDSGQRENIKIDYHKKFRWFYTFHEYSETFLQRFPYRHYNIKDFLNEKERMYFLAGDTSVIDHLTKHQKNKWENNGEEKIWDFIFQSVSAEYIRMIDSFAIENGYEQLNELQKEKICEIINGARENGPDFSEIPALTDSLLSSDWVAPLYLQGYFNQFEEELEDRMFLLNSRKYKVDIQVPGLIYNTNGQVSDGQSLKWQFISGEFQYDDKVLFVNYRTTNWWAFIVTFVITVIVLWQAFIRKK